MAHGLFNQHSRIRVRLYSWQEDRPIDDSLIAERTERAVARRMNDARFALPKGGCRLIFSEADGLSGLTVDRFGGYLVAQLTSLALARFEPVILETLERVLSPVGILRRTERGIREQEGLETDDALLAGSAPEGPVLLEENELAWEIDLIAGQKTGWYLDQRENRRAVADRAAGRSVLDVFCYAGGFGLTALRAGGVSLLGVDSSEAGLELARRNAERNDLRADFVREQASPALTRLAAEGRRFGLVVLDPPKFARSAGAVPKALRAHVQLHRQALDVLEPEGILATCSCSGLVAREDFVETLAAGARFSGREIQILEQRGAAEDHPISAYCTEGEYLHCLIARVGPP